jgi:hypothetical protein
MKKGWFKKAKEKLDKSPRRAKYNVESLNRQMKRNKPFKD